MTLPHLTNKTILITGCSSGIGRATALLLRDRGWRVLATARKSDDLSALQQDGFEAVALDLADAVSTTRAAEDVLQRTGGQLGALVNNAGFGQPGAVEDLTREDLERQFQVNVFGMQQLTNALLPVMLSQGQGRIVNVSSVLGRIVNPLVGAYCASKFAMEALSDTLRIELQGTGVWVSLIEPGPIVSAFRQNAVERVADRVGNRESRFCNGYRHEVERRRTDPTPTRRFTLPPEAVGQKILHALTSRHPRRRYRVTLPAYLGEIAARWLPACCIDRLLATAVRRALERKHPSALQKTR